MVLNKFLVHLLVRLAMIMAAMFLLVFLLVREIRPFSILLVTLVLILLTGELIFKISRTNRIISSLLESIRYGDLNRRLSEHATGMGFEELARSGQSIINAIASARIDKETQFRYLESILDYIMTGVITLDGKERVELINPLALNILGIYTNRNPDWKEIRAAAPLFADAVDSMGQSGRRMIRLPGSPGRELLVLLTTVRIREEPVRIITFQDIEPEIGEKEMESWKTISRIMAHEIMNSLTPLSSLTETGIMLLEKEGRPRTVEELTRESIENLYTALKTIADRNRSLTRFIGNYRELSRLPDPEPEQVLLPDLIREVARLHKEHMQHQGVRLVIRQGPAGHILVSADPAQLKQVLINLFKNALEAMADVIEPLLTVAVKRIMDTVAIDISDNGPGIPPEALSRIFVPFFTTKKGGSGIGLSLSRQIIRNHGGQITVNTNQGKGTTFRVVLPLNR
jgi:two-component system, NtrC family, nitrogen regulation sensor histidine kinase NtrY